jgi:hypothetical protein
MRVARLATIGFGMLTILVALLIQNMGGIVEVVLSVAAITGGALYLPPLWSLFSKRQTGKSILTATIISLLINSFFKFASPYLLNYSLTRSQEMTLGVIAPLFVLVFFELVYFLVPKENPDYGRYRKIKIRQAEETREEVGSGDQNIHGRKVISLGVMGTGLFIVTIGFFASTGKFLVLGAGATIIAVGLSIKLKKQNHNDLRLTQKSWKE